MIDIKLLMNYDLIIVIVSCIINYRYTRESRDPSNDLFICVCAYTYMYLYNIIRSFIISDKLMSVNSSSSVRLI